MMIFKENNTFLNTSKTDLTFIFVLMKSLKISKRDIQEK